MYAFIEDFSAASNQVVRRALFYILTEAGESAKMVNILEEVNRDTEVGVWCRNGLKSSFRTHSGLKQGNDLDK